MTAREIWEKYKSDTAQEQRTPSEYMEAAKAGQVMASRLAPELIYDQGRLFGRGWMFHSGGVLNRGNGDNRCCSNTFLEDFGVPEVEKALTIYLYWRLFPERFRDRPEYHSQPGEPRTALMGLVRSFFFR